MQRDLAQLRQIAWLPLPLDDAQQHRNDAGPHDADEHRRTHSPGHQCGHHQQPGKGKHGAGCAQVAQRYHRRRVCHYDARILESDEGDKQPDPNCYRRIQLRRHGLDNLLPQSRQRQQ